MSGRTDENRDTRLQEATEYFLVLRPDCGFCRKSHKQNVAAVKQAISHFQENVGNNLGANLDRNRHRKTGKPEIGSTWTP